MKRTVQRALLRLARIAASAATAAAVGLIVAYLLLGFGPLVLNLGFWSTALLVNALALDATRAWEPA